MPESLWWLRDDCGGVSGSSSEEESDAPYSEDDPQVPKWPLPPAITRDTELLAFWDLLFPPHGMSVRRLAAVFAAKHARPTALARAGLYGCSGATTSCFLERALV